jgi:hypothetical protein
LNRLRANLTLDHAERTGFLRYAGGACCSSVAKAPPTVLVSGGAGVRCFLDHPTVQTLLLHADSVIVVRDNESTAKKQAETDAAHDLQIARIRELRGNCADWRPPVGVKDVAELNQQERAGAGARRSGPALAPPATNPGGSR